MTYLTDKEYNDRLEATKVHIRWISESYVDLKNRTIEQLEKLFRDNFNKYKDNVDFYAIMVTVVNHELWRTWKFGHDERIRENERKRYNSLAKLYDRLWRVYHNKATSLFKGEDYRRYWELTD